jgi:Na+-transporting methylmalonyl-CoA/oxaloacetate decarboxylase gamma subunit
MDKWTFGFTMMIVGVSGTFLTLWILSLVIGLMKRIFPVVAEDSPPEKQS